MSAPDFFRVSATPEPSLTIEVKREARLRLIFAPSDQQHSTAGDQRKRVVSTVLDIVPGICD